LQHLQQLAVTKLLQLCQPAQLALVERLETCVSSRSRPQQASVTVSLLLRVLVPPPPEQPRTRLLPLELLRTRLLPLELLLPTAPRPRPPLRPARKTITELLLQRLQRPPLLRLLVLMPELLLLVPTQLQQERTPLSQRRSTKPPEPVRHAHSSLNLKLAVRRLSVLPNVV
jgi:hypothetical protein